MVEAADLFNASPYRRTVGGIGKSLGKPDASVVPLSGVNMEVVVTVAWDISWYQYRVLPDSAQPVRLAERGHELEELEPSFRMWNARVDPDGRVVPGDRSALERDEHRPNQRTMIYCVIPRELEDELFDKMVEYYKDNPNVTVIVDRREGPDRRSARKTGGKRETRDRRRPRIPGTFLEAEGEPEAAD